MLTIYRASAGSGKTHTLTGEFISLLFIHPNTYRRILAVTFTNKATDEMKRRVINELYYLSSGMPSDYMTSLMSAYSLSEKQVRGKAKNILTDILHDYSAFNISTIDRFFQQTMRAFTREIGLQGGYGIEMDQDLVLTSAIEKLLADLDKPENTELLGWLIKFAEEKIESGGEWNLRKDIKSLSQELFKENYKVHSEQVSLDISDKTSMEDYRTDLYALIDSVESELKRLADYGLSLIDEYALLPTNFKNESRSPFLLLEKWLKGDMKEPTATFIGLADNVEAWYSKSVNPGIKSIIECVYQNGLNDCVKNIITLFDNLTDYHTAREIVRNYYTLGILTDVTRQVNNYRKDNNIMLIADTTELLGKVIGGSETPFIYEKTGTHVDHYMIDEFQDTSSMQWHNFRPLITESLAHGFRNLIVGDVKQSIYRFRNSDWTLLDKGVKDDFRPEQIFDQTLKDNWRSCRFIVEFNNALFTVSPELLQQEYNSALEKSPFSSEECLTYCARVKEAYAKSFQNVPPSFQDRIGHVKINFIEENEEQDWKEESMKHLPGTLEQLQDQGYTPCDIAILVRTNTEGSIVADTLLSYKKEHAENNRYHYDIISDEALFIRSSSTVRFIITLLRHLCNPENQTNLRMAVFGYKVWISDSQMEGETFPPEISDALGKLSNLSLYEITEGLIALFADSVPDNEQPFLQAFLDMVSEFAEKEGSDTGRFLKWWDETGYRKTIATPDGQDAIRILTIHKSKGLGFKVVILPFCDWEIDHKPTKPIILWCKPHLAPFNRLSLVPVRYGQNLARTHFATEYFQERLQAHIDNLNALYVAFTRSKEELIITAPRPKKTDKVTAKSDRLNGIADLLWNSLLSETFQTQDKEPLITLQTFFNPEEGFFEMGTWWKPGSPKKNDSQTTQIAINRIRSISSKNRLQLRLHGKDYFFDNEDLKYGALMHEILSKIVTKKDIIPTVNSYHAKGIIGKEEASMMIVKLGELLEIPEVSAWFDGTSLVLSEVNILFDGGSSKRPDRVMIADKQVTIVDYKFGEHPSSLHNKQVHEYIELVRRIGYTKIKGYLWYVQLGQIKEV